MNTAYQLPTLRRSAPLTDQRFYLLDPPLVTEDADDLYSEGVLTYTRLVVVSASWRMHVPETYIFAADAMGNIVDFTDLPGSFQGALDHQAALRGAGYSEVVTDFADMTDTTLAARVARAITTGGGLPAAMKELEQ